MAVPEQTPYIEHIANGVTTSFALEFECKDKEHLIVLVDNVEPNVGTWSLANGSVVFGTAPANGKIISIQRNTPFRRDTNFQSYDNSLRPATINKDFDWIWYKLQELGVADWILGNRIDALKNYVDDRDDELRAYLMEEIRKQGVALDQLEDYYDYLMERLAQIAVDKGWDASFVVDKNGRNQQEINDDNLQLKDYAKYKVGNDWTAAIQKADNDAIAQSKCVNVAGGTYDYSGNITLSGHWFGSGLHCTRFRKTAPATITILNGSLRDLAISPDAIIDGDTSDGLVADGLDRKYIENVYVRFHGGNGFVYKRGNLSRFYLRSRENKKNGIVFAKDPISGDNKCVEFWFESTGNDMNGFIIEGSTNNRDISAQNKGYVIAQNNGKAGVVDNTYDAVFTGIGNDITAYTEYGGGVWHQAGLKASQIFYQNMSHPLFRNEANKSNIVSFIDSALGSRTTLFESFNSIEIQNAKLVGQLKLTQLADRKFSLDVTGSSAEQELTIGNMLTLKKGATEYLRAYKIGATLNFSAIPAKGSVERYFEIGSTLASSQTGTTAAPAVSLPSGLVWNTYINPIDLTKVVVRLTNITDAAITTVDTPWICRVFL